MSEELEERAKKASLVSINALLGVAEQPFEAYLDGLGVKIRYKPLTIAQAMEVAAEQERSIVRANTLRAYHALKNADPNIISLERFEAELREPILSAILAAMDRETPFLLMRRLGSSHSTEPSLSSSPGAGSQETSGS